jgi:alpha-galactosidase
MQANQEEMASAKKWLHSAQPRFSFIYDGNPSNNLLENWTMEASVRELDARRIERTARYGDPRTGLHVRWVALEYADFPAVEGILYFSNDGTVDTPIIGSIHALDTVFPCNQGKCMLRYSRGSVTYLDDYAPVDRALNDKKSKIHLTAGGGRSSSEHLPFFNVDLSGEGVVLGIGWTGEWGAGFAREGDRLRIQAGMDCTHFRLHPGEEVRSPRILVLFWQRDRMRGHNLLRQLILTYHCPQVDGKPLVGPVFSAGWGSWPAAIHSANIRQMISHDLPIAYYWIDAEWHGASPWWQHVGNWAVRREIYPKGFRPISDLLHNAGRKFMLWFEPYRVARGTPWYDEHGEWLLKIKKEEACWSWPHWVDFDDPEWRRCESNLGIPEARRFMTDFLSRMIGESGIDCYREDCNIAPLRFWRGNDAPDRQGITEIRWVEGLYEVWDELLRRHPGLIIDNCASGSRRIDLETLGRATPFFRTDYTNDPIGLQCHTHGILHWVPLNSTATLMLGRDDKYRFRSAMCSSLIVSFEGTGDDRNPKPIPDSFPFDLAKRSLDQYLAVQKYYYGDYYPLTEYTQADDAWMAYQLDRPDLGEGVVIALKRPLSPYVDACFPLRELDPCGEYEIADLDTDGRTIVSGETLTARGVAIHLSERPDSVLLRYRKMGKRNG